MTGVSGSPAGRLPPGMALAIFAAAVLAFLIVGSLTFSLGLGGVAITQLVAIGGVPLAAVRLSGRSATEALALRRPSGRALLGALLIGVSFWYLNMIAVAPIAEQLLREGEQRQLEQMLLGPSVPLWETVLVISLIPALCEELLVRGLVLSSLAPALGRVAAIAITAALFALLHFSLARALPTALFGALLAWIALRSRSVLPGMLVHLANNALAVLYAADALPPLPGLHARHPIPLAAAAITLTSVGIGLLAVPGTTKTPSGGTPPM
jgi:membrane protease YdiL (CAAX protease family)